MLPRDRRSRSRRLARYQSGLGAEGLESRRLLVATPINVASGLTFALALPLPSLATGLGLASTAQAVQTVTASVAPVAAPAASSFGPSPTGPSTTLSPLPNDFETAVATASEVARPTPGRSDRISSVIEAPQVVPILRLRSPDAVEVVPGPEIQARPQAPAAPAPRPAGPAQPPVEPSAPARPVPTAPSPKVAPEGPKESMNFEVWDAALDLVATDLPEDSPGSPTHRAEGAMAAGALLAAWGGWRYGTRFEGRSRRRPSSMAL